MTLAFLTMLIIATLIFLIKKEVKHSVVTLFFTLIIVILIGCGFAPAILIKQLQADFITLPKPLWQKNNAIVLLGAGNIMIPGTTNIIPAIFANPRINQAASLYYSCVKSGNKCSLIVSGGDANHVGKSEAEVYRDTLLNLGIKPSAITLETKSMNTYKNAEFTANILKKNPVDQVILVTSGIHLRRSLLYFSYFGISAQPIFADYLAAQITFLPNAYNFLLTDFAIHEHMGILRFVIYNFLGWNKKPPAAND